MAIDLKMRAVAVLLLIVQAGVAAMGFAYADRAQAQTTEVPQFLEKYFRFKTTDARDGPKLRTDFDYSPISTLVTRSSLKLNNNGFEQDMSLGSLRRFGAFKAGATYSLHRRSYDARSRQSDDITFDLYYKKLRLQHRLEDSLRESSVGIPIDFKPARIDLSFSQTVRADSGNVTEVYRLSSRVSRVKFSASWKSTEYYTWADYNAEYKPSGRWLLKYAYADHGQFQRREIRSEYARRGYRLTSECKTRQVVGSDAVVVGALGLEKNTKIAAVKLRFEYSDLVSTPSVSLNFESRALF